MNMNEKISVLIISIMSFAASIGCQAIYAVQDNSGVIASIKTLVIIGDSTVCNYPKESGRRGWGQFIQNYFSDSLVVVNMARSGRSTKTFIQEGLWKEVLDLKPDYILIQFGHNDSHAPEKPESTDAQTDYQDYLRQYVDESRRIGAVPVLVTPMYRRVFDDSGHIRDNLLPYADAMKQVAKGKNVPLVDLNSASEKLYLEMGAERAPALANRPNDQTHFNQKGAKAMAELVMQQLPQVEDSLKTYLKKKDDSNNPQNMPAEIEPINAPFPMPQLQRPVFQNKAFDIKDYGAVEGGDIKNTEAIARAIKACHEAGGGRVVVPEGKWLTGKVHLKSNVNLHVEKGALLEFSENPEDYLPAVQTTWEGMECFNYSPLIYAFDCKNVAVTGEGPLDAKMEVWKTWFSRPPAHMEALKKLYTMASTNIPVQKRQMAEGQNHLRPQFIQFNRCENVLLEDVSIVDSPFWVIHPFLCRNVIIRGVKVRAHGHNNDGVDPEMSQNVLIEDCVFDQGDDAIAIKAGRNQDAWRLDTPTENVVMRNCLIKKGHQLVAIGSELSGGIRNVYVHDCRFENPDFRLQNVIFIKTNERRGGFVENIYVENIEAGPVRYSMLGIETDVLYQWRDLVPTYEKRLTKIKNIQIKNVTVDKAEYGLRILGNAEEPVRDITLENVTVKEVLKKDREVRNAENIQETNVRFGI
jgi:polygalacturonase/lysophospholipase L1-like esterase